MPQTDLSTHLETLASTCPRFVSTGDYIVNAKSVLLFGTLEDRPAVAKMLHIDDASWVERFDRELSLYSAPMPPAIAAVLPVPYFISKRPRVLVLERLAGAPLASGRFFPTGTTASQIDRCIDALALFGQWQPGSEGEAAATDIVLARLLREDIPPDVRSRLEARANDVGPSLQFAHRDPLPSNIFYGRTVRLIDLEHAGYDLPAYDLALLWVLLADNPQLRPRVAAAVPAGLETSFRMAVYLLLKREARLQVEAGDTKRAEQVVAAAVGWERAC